MAALKRHDMLIEISVIRATKLKQNLYVFILRKSALVKKIQIKINFGKRLNLSSPTEELVQQTQLLSEKMNPLLVSRSKYVKFLITIFVMLQKTLARKTH